MDGAVYDIRNKNMQIFAPAGTAYNGEAVERLRFMRKM